MTTVAIMQPTFLPWSGYLDLMDQVDTFVYLDSVQFAHRSWQHRNRVAIDGELRWISVPTVASDRRARRIDEIEIGRSDEFPGRVLGRIDESLRAAPHRDRLASITRLITETEPGTRLVDLDLALLEELRVLTGVDTPTLRASRLPVDGSRSHLLISIACCLNADVYVTPPGSLDYLHRDAEHFAAAGVEVQVHRYEHPSYARGDEPFVPYASVVDLIAHVGPDAPAVLRDGRHDPVSLVDFAPVGG